MSSNGINEIMFGKKPLKEIEPLEEPAIIRENPTLTPEDPPFSLPSEDPSEFPPDFPIEPNPDEENLVHGKK